ALACLLLTSGCAPSTTLSKSWRDPATTITMGQFSKILIAAFVKDETSRRIIEDDVVKMIKGKAVASYQVLGSARADMSEEELAAKVQGEGFDAAVVMRMLDMEKEMEYVPGTGAYPAYYRGFYGFYRGVYSGFYNPGYYQENKIYSVETNIYSLKENKLIWSGVTETVNPTKLDKMVSEIGKVIFDEMKKQGFLY
ncbi:MAG TPA: hypothetical protein VK907_04625, partial [Phnomibacter sp.]|nr:hypothetical protein [Phnomibacter sp.]